MLIGMRDLITLKVLQFAASIVRAANETWEAMRRFRPTGHSISATGPLLSVRVLL